MRPSSLTYLWSAQIVQCTEFSYTATERLRYPGILTTPIVSADLLLLCAKTFASVHTHYLNVQHNYCATALSKSRSYRYPKPGGNYLAEATRLVDETAL